MQENTMKTPKVEDVKRGISVLWETLRCPICLDLMNNPVSTKCDHQFCKFCMTKLLDCSKRKEANCPICQTKISKRSLQESPGFQRLVEGLQNMIQAFEHDSSTNYFTGMSQQRIQTCVQSKTYFCNGDKVSSVDTPETDLIGEKEKEQNDQPTSLTSTLAAKDGFANLMGLEDSCPISSDNEGFDSGLGEAPTTEKEMDFKACSSHAEGQEPEGDTVVTHIVETSTSRPRSRGRKRITESAKPSCQLVLIPEGVENQTVRRSSRNVNKETSTPEKMIDLRQKKSLEKVSEWLIKNPPLEENSEVENVTRASEDSASVAGDFSATAIFPDNVEMMEGGLKREERVKGIEEQVFGAVYKRERRGVLGFSPQNRGVKNSPASHLGGEAQVLNKAPKRQMNRHLKPNDVVKRPCSEDIFNDEPEESEKHDICNESEKPQNKSTDLNQELGSSSADGHGNGSSEVPKEINNEVEGQQEHDPPFGVLRRLGKRTSRRKMSDNWQKVDGDLQVEAKTKLEMSEKKNSAKKKREADTGKSVKVPKPLVLVGVGEDDCNPIEIPKTGLRAVETAVHIENYPSSEEIGSPSMRQTRKSKRLQHFTEEVQGSHKKSCSAKNTSCLVNVGTADTELALSSQAIKRNGCVYDEDMGGIENMDSKCTGMTMEKTNPVDCMTQVSGIPFEANATCSEAMLTCSGSPKTNIPRLKAVDHNNSVVDQSNEAASASEARCVEMEKEEEDINDSELDTEQLVKSFKEIKRKSFRLSPTMKKSDPKPDMDEQNGAKSKENNVVGSGVEVDGDEEIPSIKECSVVQKQLGARAELENSCYSDLIPPSNSPAHILQKATLRRRRGQKKSIGNRPSVEMEESSNQNANVVTQENLPSQHSGNSVSSVLSPNKVAKSQLLSPHPVNSQPLFPVFGASEEDSSARTLGSPKQSTVNQEQHLLSCSWQKSLERSPNPKSETTVEQQKCLDKTNANVANSEASLTPDGLLPQISQTAVNQAVESAEGNSETSVHILIRSNPKQRRRKAIRLESSESDSSNEEDQLPSLAQIFRSSSDPPEDQVSARVLKESCSLSSGKVKDQKPPAKADRVEVTHAVGGLAELDDVPPACGGSEWVNSSQASVDLFGTPDECEAAVSDTGLSMESSQFSSEIIATQQKIAMQEELKRLENLMALVSEALQEKEATSNLQLQPQTDSLAGPNLHMNLPCGGEICFRECATDREGDAASMPPGSGASEGLGPTQPSAPKHEGTKGMAGQRCRQSQSGRSLRSIHANKIPTPVGSGGKPGEPTTHPSSISPSQCRESKENREDAPSMDTSSAHRLQRDHASATLVLVPSGLGVNEQTMLKKFAKRIGGRVCSQVTAQTTHVIMNTDEQLVCERTLKYFLGIAGRKWVVSFQWISECFQQEKLLRETPYEVQGDVVNGHSHQGPTRARVTGDSNLLMKDYEICFQGTFSDMTTGQMEWMVELCGGRLVKDPLLFTDKRKSHQVVIVQPGSDLSEARNYKALQRNATVVTRGWLLDTVATYTIQNLDNYKT